MFLDQLLNLLFSIFGYANLLAVTGVIEISIVLHRSLCAETLTRTQIPIRPQAPTFAINTDEGVPRESQGSAWIEAQLFPR